MLLLFLQYELYKLYIYNNPFTFYINAVFIIKGNVVRCCAKADIFVEEMKRKGKEEEEKKAAQLYTSKYWIP